MYHSITFSRIGDDPWVMQTGKNTWDDWHIVPDKRPVFSPPAVKEHTVDIPGKDGVLDFTDSLTGFPLFERREGSFEFIVMNGYQEWHQLYSTIASFLHGKVLRAVLEDDPNYYYEGRFTINDWKSEKDRSRIVIGYKVSPYKWRISPYVETKVVNPVIPRTSIAFNMPNALGDAAVYPTVTVSGGVVTIDYIARDRTGSYVEKTVTLEDGTYALIDCLIQRYLPSRSLAIAMVSVTGQYGVTVEAKVRKGEL